MATASTTPQDTNYSQWFAEDVVNAVIAPPTIVPARSTILDHSWISNVSPDHTNPHMVGGYDYIFGFEYSPPVVHCYGITVNPDIRMGANGSGGSSGSGGFANAYFGPMKSAVDLYAATSPTPGPAFQPGRGAGTSPLSMHNAATTLLSFKNWLDGSDASGGNPANPGAAPTLAAWVKWLGSEQATWQGTAADAVYQLITELGSVLTAWQSQLDGTGAGSMPELLDDAAFALSMVGADLKVAYDAWSQPSDGGYNWWHPENGIRAALTARGLIVGGMNGVWDLTYPTDRSGLLKGSETQIIPAGWTVWPVSNEPMPSMTIDQAVWYLRDAANPTGMLQTEAKSYWTWQMTQLDEAFTAGLVHLASVYGTSTAGLTPLITPTLHAITVTPPVTPPPTTHTPPPTTHTPPPTTHTPPPTTHVPPPTTQTPPPTNHLPPPTTPPNVHPGDPNGATPPPVKLADFGGSGGTVNLPKLPTDPWAAGGAGPAGLGSGGLGGLGPLGLGAFGGLGGPGGLGSGEGGLTAAEQAAAKRAAAMEGAAAGAGAGEGGIPMYPPGGGMGMGGQGGDQHDRERHTWISEDESVWGTDPDLPPAVFGRI